MICAAASAESTRCEDQAFDALRRCSQENNVKLREVARLAHEQGSLSWPLGKRLPRHVG